MSEISPLWWISAWSLLLYHRVLREISLTVDLCHSYRMREAIFGTPHLQLLLRSEISLVVDLCTAESDARSHVFARFTYNSVCNVTFGGRRCLASPSLSWLHGSLHGALSVIGVGARSARRGGSLPS